MWWWWLLWVIHRLNHKYSHKVSSGENCEHKQCGRYCDRKKNVDGRNSHNRKNFNCISIAFITFAFQSENMIIKLFKEKKRSKRNGRKFDRKNRSLAYKQKKWKQQKSLSTRNRSIWSLRYGFFLAVESDTVIRSFFFVLLCNRHKVNTRIKGNMFVVDKQMLTMT